MKGWTLDSYKRLCAACDHVLLSSEATRVTAAISWLHVIREHPSLLAAYDKILEERVKKESWAYMLKQFFNKKLSWYKSLVLSISKPWRQSNFAELNNTQIDFLFISHLVHKNQLTAKEDFYFCSLPIELHKSGQRVAIAYINHLNHNVVIDVSTNERAAIKQSVFSRWLDFSSELKLRVLLKRERKRLFQQSINIKDYYQRRVMREAAREALTSSSINNLRIYEQIIRLVSKIRPRALIVTYEGHAWEKMALSAARTVNPNILCVGYQHAAIFRHQHAIRRNLQAQYNPSIIFTAGLYGLDSLRESLTNTDLDLTAMGTNRVFSTHHLSHSNLNSDRKNILVLPEGIYSECHRLFSFSIEAARKLPDINFIWRLHPVIDRKVLSRQRAQYQSLPPNIQWSQSTLSEDATTARFVLYRGSTAIIEAVGARAIPIYLDFLGELEIDPLHCVAIDLIRINSVEELKDIVESNLTFDPAVLKELNKIFIPLQTGTAIETMARHLADHV